MFPKPGQSQLIYCVLVLLFRFCIKTKNDKGDGLHQYLLVRSGEWTCCYHMHKCHWTLFFLPSSQPNFLQHPSIYTYVVDITLTHSTTEEKLPWERPMTFLLSEMRNLHLCCWHNTNPQYYREETTKRKDHDFSTVRDVDSHLLEPDWAATGMLVRLTNGIDC